MAYLNFLSQHLWGGTKINEHSISMYFPTEILTSHVQGPLKSCIFRLRVPCWARGPGNVWMGIKVNGKFRWKKSQDSCFLIIYFCTGKIQAPQHYRSPIRLGYVNISGLADCATLVITEQGVLRVVWFIDLLFNLLCVLWTSLTMRESNRYIYREGENSGDKELDLFRLGAGRRRDQWSNKA
jgi:hypothetical protein